MGSNDISAFRLDRGGKVQEPPLLFPAAEGSLNPMVAGAGIVEDGSQVIPLFGAQSFRLNSCEMGLGDHPGFSHAQAPGGSSC